MITSHASAMAAFLRVQLTDRGIGEALMTLIRMAKAGDREAHEEVHKAVKWLMEEWKA